MKKLNIFSSISFRLLVFNVLIVFFPIASFLFLSTYEQQLLQYLEHALVQQGRVIAAALGSNGELTEDSALGLLMRLERRHDARLRVLDSTGQVLADSSVLPPKEDADKTVLPYGGRPSVISREKGDTGWKDETAPVRLRDASESVLYRFASFPVRIFRNYLLPPAFPIESGDFYQGSKQLLGEEVQAALSGRYGAATRISTGGQISVTLYSALPIYQGGEVKGVVLVSQSTYRILQDLYRLRLDIFKIFLLSFAAAVIISVFLSITISRPLKNLSKKAQKIFTPQGKFEGRFSTRNRNDEIGKLAGTLDKLTDELREHISFIESFAADVSHELKNPIASIRSSAEIVAESIGSGRMIEDEARRFLGIIQKEAARMESLIATVREISKIDTRLQEEEMERVDICKIVSFTLESFNLRAEEKGIRLYPEFHDESVFITASPGRISQIVENIIDNALSFAPPYSTITVQVRKEGGCVSVTVCDEGPGIPLEIKDKIFSRFYSYREQAVSSENGISKGPDKPLDTHAGLGLAIVKAIVEGYDGNVKAENRDEGSGARITVELPAG
jgi:two-component system sensor histidine kinase ChvG